MTDRTTKVTMIAQVSNYVANMQLATKATRDVGDAAVISAEKQKAASAKVGAAFLAIGAVAAVGVALAIKEFAEFDAKMAQVATLSHASADDLKNLTEQALNAGQKIGFSATQVADAEIELVKAGISVKDIIGGALPGALQLAAAGQIDVADATTIATIAMTQFNLKGKDIPHVADLLTAGADKALGGVSDLGEALKSGGLVADQFGVSLEETIGTLSAFANAGLIGETAGTDLRQMFLKLANPATDAAATMKDLGIEVYDAAGKFVGISDLAGQLQDKLGGLSESQRNAALATIFGSRAIVGANILYKEGADGIKKWTAAVDDNGFAQQQAAGKMNNLQGDLKKLQAAFQSGVIEAGSGANDVLREFAQTLTFVVSGLGKLPQPVLAGGLALGTVVAVTSLVTGGFLVGVPKVLAFRDALQTVGIGGKAAALGIGAVSLAVAALIIVLAAVADTAAKSEALTASYGDTLDETSHKITSASREIAKANLATRDSFLGVTTQSAYEGAKKLGISLNTVTNAALGNVDALNKLKPLLSGNIVANGDAAAKKAGLSYREWSEAVLALRGGVLSNNQSIEDAIRIAKEKADADKGSVDGTKAVAGGLDGVTSSAGDANSAITDLATTLKNFGSATLDARSAERDFQQSVDDAADAVKKNGKTLDINTQAGRDNQAALDKIASSANAAAAAIYSQTGSVDDASAALNDGRAALIASAEQMGLTEQAASDLADQILATPAEVATSVKVNGIPDAQKSVDDFFNTNTGRAIKSSFGADTTPAQAAIDAFILKNNNSKITLQVAASSFGANNSKYVLQNLLKSNGGTDGGGAGGGIIPGHPSYSDDKVYNVASGEFITNAASTSDPYNRAALEFMNNGGNINQWSPAQTYSPAASSASGTSVVVNIPVQVTAGAIGDEAFLAKTVRMAVKNTIKVGDIPQDWLA